MAELIVVQGDLDIENGQGLSISVPGFKGQPTAVAGQPSQVCIFVEDDTLKIRVWSGDEDPSHYIDIEKARTCGECKSYSTEEEEGRNGKTKTIDKCFYGCRITKKSEACIEFEER